MLIIFDLSFTILMFFGALYDIKKRIIPNKLCLIMLITFILKSSYLLIFNRNNPEFSYSNFFSSILTGFLLAFITLGIPFFISKTMGGGDIKAGCCIGLFLGFKNTLSLFFISFFSCALFALFINISKTIMKKPKIKTLPFAPFLLLGYFHILSLKYLF